MKFAPEPAAGDVRDGTVVGSVTGTLELPDQTDVRDGVQYGAGGTEFEGSLVAGGGGGPLVGLGGLVS